MFLPISFQIRHYSCVYILSLLKCEIPTQSSTRTFQGSETYLVLLEKLFRMDEYITMRYAKCYVGRPSSHPLTRLN